jgi:chorismate lyase / 3-hydroxybenzoate synthase
LKLEKGLQCLYANNVAEWGDNERLLLGFSFDVRANFSQNRNLLSTGLPTLSAGTLREYFVGDNKPIVTEQRENLLFVETQDYLLTAVWASEKNGLDLVQTTEILYAQLLGLIRRRGYPHLVRIWNYFAGINREENGMERYRQFCLGRYNALTQRELVETQYPSACALGHSGGDFLVYALATKIPPLHYENPRQASAYHYPSEYGPRSPSFARASLLQLPGKIPQLFVSGTASVVGSATQHPYDLIGQINETLENLSSLLAHVLADQHSYSPISTKLEAEILKVYVRNPEDLAQIKHHIDRAYPQVPVVYLRADICRSDLLLEIDGIWNLLP